MVDWRRDCHPELGPKTRHPNLASALAAVRSVHPEAFVEGSAGYQRSFWLGRSELVGYAWAVRPNDMICEELWLRVKPDK